MHKILHSAIHHKDASCTNFLEYCFQKVYYEQAHDSLFFFKDSVMDNYRAKSKDRLPAPQNQAFVAQMQVHLPKGATSQEHSVIIYEPWSDRYFCANMFLHKKIRGEDRPPLAQTI